MFSGNKKLAKKKRRQSNEIKDVKLQTENGNKRRRIDIQTGKAEIGVLRLFCNSTRLAVLFTGMNFPNFSLLAFTILACKPGCFLE